MKSIEWNGQTFGLKYISQADLEVTPEADKAFAYSIKDRIDDAILVDEANEIIDGLRRLKRAVKLGLSPEKVRIDKIAPGLTDLQKKELRDDLNHHRRPTTRKKLREIIERRIKAHPLFNDKTIAGMLGTTHDTVNKVRKALERAGEVQHAARRTDSRGRSQPTTKRPKSPTAATAKHPPSKVEWQVFKQNSKKITTLAVKIEKYAGIKKQQQDRTQMLELARGVHAEADKLVQQLSAPSKPSGPDGTPSEAEPGNKPDYQTDEPGSPPVSAPAPANPLGQNLLVQQSKRAQQAATTPEQQQGDQTQPKASEPEAVGTGV